MSEEPTQNLPDQRSFEEQVLARFDAIDQRFNAIDKRFDAVDMRFDAIEGRLEKLESRNYDTKPIWERALKAIMDTGLEVGEIKTRVGVIENKVGVIENKVGVIENKVGVIENKVGVIDDKVGVIEERIGAVENKIQLLEKEIGAMKITFRNELVDVRRALSHKIRDRLDLIAKYLLEGRDDMRDAEDRIRELESKFA